jgi:hypothetical protein
MDTDTINLIARENNRQAFLEEKQAIRKVANRGILESRKQELVNLIKNPLRTDDLSYLVGNVF